MARAPAIVVTIGFVKSALVHSIASGFCDYAKVVIKSLRVNL